MIASALKTELTNEAFAKIIDANTRPDGNVNYWGLITAFELLVIEKAFEVSNLNNNKAALSLAMGRTTFIEKRRKYRG